MRRTLSSFFIASLAWLLATAADAAGTPIPRAPDIDAKSYILMDFESGRVLAEKNADAIVEPASITKVMTVYIAFDEVKKGRLKMSDLVPISEKAWRQGIDSTESRMFLDVGSKVPLIDLLRGIVIQSGNDAAVAVAEYLGGTEQGFAEIMNHYAAELGMKNTHYVDASGMPDPQHHTTARDIATLSRALIRNFPEEYKMFAEREFTFHNIRQYNRNGLLGRDDSVDGIKTGHTQAAGYCLAASAKRGDMRLISVVMGAPSIKAREAANAALLGYGYTFYETGKVKSRGEVVLKPRVYKSDEGTIAVGVKQDVWLTLGRGELAGLKTTANVKEPLVAPLAANQSVGDLIVTNTAGETVAKVPLYPMKAVPEAGLWTQMVDTVALWF
ncbi:MAG TPA: D-alanyl-D-alanine carboxypeptidase family protein [Steroidobacteraceae bacterium]|jgi:D-alanyl-D-alanine carboxypeptidase (penicillin-binding protein 5/6)|nr:D-alanyl-D-alanine carboxypeptidase family protein [Steroidobacteraceae bacterium]